MSDFECKVLNSDLFVYFLVDFGVVIYISKELKKLVSDVQESYGWNINFFPAVSSNSQ